MIQIRDTEIGSGIPKISVPVTGADERSVLLAARKAYESPADIIEWRADTFERWNDHEALLRMLKTIRMAIGDKILCFTFRTSDEGGLVRVRDEEYIAVTKRAIDSRLVDMVDVECCVSEYRASELLNYAKNAHVITIGSNHSFHKLLSTGEMDFRIRYMQRLGADIVKLVVVPESKKDIFKILNAVKELTDDLNLPLEIIAKTDNGKYSRILGELYGTAITCGTLDAEANPGEIEVYKLYRILKALHEM